MGLIHRQTELLQHKIAQFAPLVINASLAALIRNPAVLGDTQMRWQLFAKSVHWENTVQVILQLLYNL